jgi:hypothetical protein
VRLAEKRKRRRLFLQRNRAPVAEKIAARNGDLPVVARKMASVLIKKSDGTTHNDIREE